MRLWKNGHVVNSFRFVQKVGQNVCFTARINKVDRCLVAYREAHEAAAYGDS